MSKNHHKRVSFGSVVKQIGHGIAPITKPIGHVVNKEINTVDHLGSKALDTVGSLGSSLSMPLILIGGAALIYVATKK